MQNLLRSIISNKVSSGEIIHDYLQIKFENLSILNIYNTYKLYPNVPNYLELLNGAIVIDLSINEKNIKIKFSSQVLIDISLLDEDFSGPEAVHFIDANGKNVIVN